MTAAEARARFAAARVARLATVAVDGHPHLVPIVFAVIGDRVYSAVDDKPKRTRALSRLDNVAAHPEVCLLADHYAEEWSELWWVRADGRARVLDDGAGGGPGADAAEARQARAQLAERYPQQRGAGTVLAVDVQRWSGWAATG